MDCFTKKEQTKTRIAIPPQPPQAKRTQTRERPSSALLPPRDPLLHPAMITSPCPIPEGQQQTLVELRSYTHVSEQNLGIYICIVYDLQFFCSLQDNKFINCILTCRLDYFFSFSADAGSPGLSNTETKDAIPECRESKGIL